MDERLLLQRRLLQRRLFPQRCCVISIPLVTLTTRRTWHASIAFLVVHFIGFDFVLQTEASRMNDDILINSPFLIVDGRLGALVKRLNAIFAEQPPSLVIAILGEFWG